MDNQDWFWTEEWQKREQEAEEDLAAGRYKDFNSIDDLVADLEAFPIFEIILDSASFGPKNDYVNANA